MKDRKIYDNKYRENNKEKLLKDIKEYRKNNKEKILKCKKQYYQKNKDHLDECIKQWRKSNSEHINKYAKEWRREKYKTDLKYNISNKMKSNIYQSISKNKAGRHWENLVGYTLENLIRRLKETMPLGYTWEDFLKGRLHIDHKIPISVFNFTRPEHIDFRRCWALENLRLLPAKENRIKKDKLTKPFQPALAI